VDDADSWRIEYSELPDRHLLHRTGNDTALGPLGQASLEYLLVIFVLFLVVNLALISLLAYLGVRLLKGDEAAILHTSAVLFAEIVSFFLSTYVFWYHFPKYVPVFDTCTDLIGPQIVTGYPVLGMVVTLVLAMRIRRNAADNATTSVPS